MGNSSSSAGRHQEDTVDYGSLVPQGVYTGPRDWNQPIVSQLIAARKLAPFYRPLEEYEESWDDDQVLAARKEFPDSTDPDGHQRADHSSSSSSSRSSHGKRPVERKEFRPEVSVYRGALECPICFLYYPRNINYSRCCGQAICTECFVQIKRAEPTTTHLVSEPAACPYCVQDNFGIVYTPPPWRAGIGSDGYSPLTPTEVNRQIEQASIPTHKRRQKSFSAESPEVVTIDQIRPDWEAKLAAVRAAVARRANRRIIMRQVGDRLIPVGIGRIQTPEEAAEAAANGGSSSRRRRHHANNGEYGHVVNVAGQDLEELMLMEAMRLSLIDHEEHQRKEAEERKKKEAEQRAAAAKAEGQGSSTGDASSSLQPTSSGSTSGRPSSSRSRSPSTSQTPESSSPSLSINRTAPPFSALNAALLTSGTATAFLNSSSAPAPPSAASSIPAITLSEGPAPEDHSAAAASLPSTSALSGDPPRSSTSVSSSEPGPDPAGIYGSLPSSPDYGQTPLLGKSTNGGLSSGENPTPSNPISKEAAKPEDTTPSASQSS